MTWQDLKAELIIDPNYSVSEITIIENAMLAIYKIKGSDPLEIKGVRYT